MMVTDLIVVILTFELIPHAQPGLTTEDTEDKKR